MTTLTEKQVANIKPGAKLNDPQVPGLFIEGTKTGGKWVLRYTSPTRKGDNGKFRRRDMGLGVYPEVGLKAARNKAIDARRVLDAGKDPIDEREREQAEAVRVANLPNFGEAAKKCHADKKKEWKDTKNVKQWLASIQHHLAPLLSRPVDSLKARDFADALRDAWTASPSIAADVLARARAVMHWCEAHEYINGDPTARVRVILGKQKRKTQHQPSLPWRVAPAFVREHLSNIDPAEAKRAALFVLIHTATRPEEVCAMRREELDLENAVWLIPGDRMKMKKAHRVPLAPVVVDLLRVMVEAKVHDEYVFPNDYNTRSIPKERLQKFLKDVKAPSDYADRFAVPHGFRSTFKGWATTNKYDDRESERALAHGVKGETAQAYDREDLFEARRVLMDMWADYLHQPANVVQLPAAKAA